MLPAKSTIFTVSRKDDLPFVKEILKDKQVFQIGPDPIPWELVMRKKNEGLSWSEIHSLITQKESSADEGSDWLPDTDTEDTDDTDEEYEDDFEEEEYEDEEDVELGKRKQQCENVVSKKLKTL